MSQADRLSNAMTEMGEDASAGLACPTHWRLFTWEMMLLIIRAGPLLGLLLTFGTGWIQRVCTLLWMWSSFAGRSVCQSVWSRDVGRHPYLVLYLYTLLLIFCWLIPHSATVKIGLMSLTALPYLYPVTLVAASRTMSFTFTKVIRPLMAGSLRGLRRRRIYQQQGTVAQGTVAQDTVPQATVPQATVSQATVPQDTVSQATVAQDTVAQVTVTQVTVSQATVPQDTVSQATVLQATVSQATVSQGTVPQGTVPQGTVPQGTVPQGTCREAATSPATTCASSCRPICGGGSICCQSSVREDLKPSYCVQSPPGSSPGCHSSPAAPQKSCHKTRPPLTVRQAFSLVPWILSCSAVWILQTIIQVFTKAVHILLVTHAWTPRLETTRRETSNIYHGLGEDYTQHLRKHNTKLTLLTMLPWKSFSRLWGFLHRLYLPYFLRYLGFSIYIWLFKVDLTEAEEPHMGRYRNLSQFFCRHLRPGLRPVDPNCCLVSPVDGRILHLCPAQCGVVEQVKGVNYSIHGFLGPVTGLQLGAGHQLASALGELTDEEYEKRLVTRPGNVLWQSIIYLAPGDYHHFHSPADWNIRARRHIPGELFSVNPGIARWLQGLFSFNERVVFTGTWQHGFFSFTAVGATNVGSISVDFDKDLATNRQTKYERDSYFDHSFLTGDQEKRASPDGLRVHKGQHVGQFHLGSTIVLLLEAPRSFRFTVQPGEKVKYGQPLGHHEPLTL